MEIKYPTSNPCVEHVFTGLDADPNVTPPTPTPHDNDSYFELDAEGNELSYWVYDASEGVWRKVSASAETCVDYYSAVHTLATGTTVIPHNLNLADPNAFLIELWSETDGDFVHPRITATTADTITLTSTVEATNVRVTVKAAEGCAGGGAEATNIPVLHDGAEVTAAMTSLNFVGATVTADAGAVTVTVDAAPALIVNDEGVEVEDATVSLNFTGNVTATTDGAGNVTVNVPAPLSFAQLVYTNAADPNTATIYDTAYPAATNNPALAQQVANLYVGSGGSTWVWNGTAYVTKPVTPMTEWNLQGTNTDAGSDKTSRIWRNGAIMVGDGITSTTNSNRYFLARGNMVANPSIFGFENTAHSNTGVFLGNGGGANFLPIMRFVPSGAVRSILIGQVATDTGSEPALQFRANLASDGPIVNRPIVEYVNGGVGGTRHYQMRANGWSAFGSHTALSRIDTNGSFGAQIVEKSAAYTLTAEDFSVIVTAAGATQTLPAPSTATRRIVVVKNASTGTVDVTGTIDVGTVTLSAGDSMFFQSNGTTWYALKQPSSGGSAGAPIGVEANLPTNLSVATGTQTQITGMATISSNAGAAWNATAGTFTAPKTGWYHVKAAVNYQGGTWGANTYSRIDIYKNGVQAITALDSNGPTSISSGQLGAAQLSDSMYLSYGDVIDVRVLQNSGSAKTTSVAPAALRFSIVSAT